MITLHSAQVLAWIDPQYCVRLTQALVNVFWEGGVIAILYAAAVWFLRGASANSRYAAGVAALVLMAACLPLTLLVLPAPATLSVADLQLEAVREKTPGPIEAAPGVMPLADQRANAASAPIPSNNQPSRQSTSDTAQWLTWVSPYATALYLCGVLAMLMRLSLGLWGGRRLRLTSTPCRDEALLQLVADQARGLRLRTTPQIAWCARLVVPVVVGVLRPIILLPAILATELTTDQLRAVLLHELAHVRRYDLAVNVLQRMIEAVLFFHPAVWWISRRVSMERENACDDLVLQVQQHPLQYADALMRVAELSTSASDTSPSRRKVPVDAALAATGENSSQFKRRILRLMGHDDEPRILLSRSGLLLCLLAIVSLLIAPAIVHTQDRNQPTSTASDKPENQQPAAAYIIGGHCFDAIDNSALGGIRVHLFAAKGRTSPPVQIAEAVTATDGSFEFGNLASPRPDEQFDRLTYQVFAEDNNRPSTPGLIYPRSRGDKDIEIRMGREQATLTGKVVNEQGEPVAGATVMQYSLDGARSREFCRPRPTLEANLRSNI